MTPDAAFGSLTNHGISAAAAHVFSDSPHDSCDLTLRGIREVPSSDANFDASPRRLRPRHAVFGGNGYVQALCSIERIKTFLLDGAAVVILIFPNDAYQNMGPHAHPATPRPFRVEDVSRGTITHAVCVIGFLESEKSFVIQDSRGVEFALQGQWLLPYEAVLSPFVHDSIYGIYSLPS